VGVALRDAFRAAERRLVDFKRKQHGEVKVHEEDGLLAAQVSQLNPDEDHGFLLTPTGGQLYFHRNSMVNRDFDRLEVGAKVHYIETVGDTGPIANKVWRAEGERG
jgi:cold shock CspA family protein